MSRVSPFALVFLLFASLCEASIKVIATDKEYSSRPDHHTGVPLKLGLQYQARLQYLPKNSHLCDNDPLTEPENWTVTVPEDGLPGTLYSLRCLQRIKSQTTIVVERKH